MGINSRVTISSSFQNFDAKSSRFRNSDKFPNSDTYPNSDTFFDVTKMSLSWGYTVFIIKLTKIPEFLPFCPQTVHVSFLLYQLLLPLIESNFSTKRQEIGKNIFDHSEFHPHRSLRKNSLRFGLYLSLVDWLKFRWGIFFC